MGTTLFDHYTHPDDFAAGTWVGRAWLPGTGGGPAVVVIDAIGVYDISASVATVSALFELDDPVGFIKAVRRGPLLGSVESLLRNSDLTVRDPAKPWLLSPIDCQAIKAAGVTFAASMVERVVEEQAKGDPGAADAIRSALAAEIGADLGSVKPGSEAAAQLKAALVERGLWSQYLEVGIGPDAEVFTKAQPLSSVGFGAEIGIHPASTWNNPEPEIVLLVSSKGRIVGATLGNDVNLRDVEGRSALLLSKAKDNNGSTAIGPFVRLFDGGFSLDDIRATDVALRVEGTDGFVLDGLSSMSRISRDPADIVAQTVSAHHQYPDGFCLFLGTMFAPTQERAGGGGGFTHKLDDIVVIRSRHLGALVNRVRHTDQVTPWTFGVRALIENLAARGLSDVAVTPKR
ncbi:MAG TPA: fumarylacetoacetate hydrolase family protein [Aliidongia sp.]|uniref:fumarylacetoacetate hydrolase family protein n=1 Tax=Aliidongia sp. TaxID=1914230 RepID=UPI002DDCD783|nr:fumarylacetoacetate hydrolase family protein [Aliidongia sp.]HEV2676536.1 fumarylacetoacetate hydrolase family protein [Aliidongia sp.]